jgi:hypothetical protein
METPRIVKIYVITDGKSNYVDYTFKTLSGALNNKRYFYRQYMLGNRARSQPYFSVIKSGTTNISILERIVIEEISDVYNRVDYWRRKLNC